ncbi:MAG TPA: hypothetical protein VHV78_08635, partial [Gemmatimonadaceae bacterium]|nr:hypothetical protein [Gemmatimonadaceae bacterium]
RLDLRYAIRSLRHDLAFTTFAMLIVGLGVGACAIVFSLMDGVSLRPLPFNDPSRLVRISSVADDGTSEWRRSVAPQVLPLRELLLSPPSLSPEESRNARRALMLLTGAGLLVQSFPAFAGCQARFPTPRRRGDAMRHVMHVLAPDQPVELLSPLPALVAAERAQPLFQARLIAAFSLLGLVLAAIGMYSTVAYSVTHRMRELGIRLALGVRPRASSVSCRVASRRVAVRCSRSSASPRASRPGGVHRSRSPCNANRSNCAAPGDLIDTAWVLAA